jgi:glycosyltransferase involved in cell wall biosynthesis
MTLWFDVSDLCIRTEPQPTGIQRTVVSVLAELIALRRDVRLFRYDHRARALRAVETWELPADIGRRIAADGGAPSRPPRAAPARFKPPLRQRAGRLVRRWGGDDIAVALKDCIGDAGALWRALRRRAQGAGRGAGEEDAPLPPPLDGAALPRLRTPFFEAGDVCLSLSATWLLRGYGALMARHKAATAFTCVNLLYDLIPALFPQWLSPGHARSLAAWAHQQIANADIVLTISNFQKREMEAYIAGNALPSRPVQAIRLGDSPRPIVSGACTMPRHVPGRRFVLCVSSIDERKNQLCLYHVWRRLARELGNACPELLLVGTAHDFACRLRPQISRDPLVRGLIVHLSDVPDDELAWYYRNCAFTVYPSFYEGWGLPVSESLALGRYCIASDAASLPEAGGSLADYFDPIDVMACYRLVRRALTRPDLVRQREEAIRRGYSAHSWRAAAHQICEVIDAASRIRRPTAERANVWTAATAGPGRGAQDDSPSPA